MFSGMDSPDPDMADNTADLERRFAGIGRLYGRQALARFTRARVCVLGIGGVGSWAAEALARSAIGHTHAGRSRPCRRVQHQSATARINRYPGHGQGAGNGRAYSANQSGLQGHGH